MGDYEAWTSVCVESSLGYHPCSTGILTRGHESGLGTVSGGQFDWAIKVVRELGSGTSRQFGSLSVAGVGNLRRPDLSTRGPGWTYRWCTCCSAKGMAGQLGTERISAEGI